jgi:hypothetical protein
MIKITAATHPCLQLFLFVIFFVFLTASAGPSPSMAALTTASSDQLPELWAFGLLCRRKSNHASAISTFRQCLSINEESGGAWEKEVACRFNLAAELGDVGDYSSAIAELLSLVERVDKLHGCTCVSAGYLSSKPEELISHLRTPAPSPIASLPQPLPAIVQAAFSSLASLYLKVSPLNSPALSLVYQTLSLGLQKLGSAEAGDYYNLNIALRQLDRGDDAIALVFEYMRGCGVDIAPIALEEGNSATHAGAADMNSERINVVCVKYGTKYGADYVNNLYAGVQRNLAKSFVFHCFTDDCEGIVDAVETHSLGVPDSSPFLRKRNNAGWWHKATLFDSPVLRDEVCLYIDLDTVVVGSLDAMLEKLCSRNSFFATLGTEGMVNERRSSGLNTSVMLWKSSVELAPVCSALHANFDAITKFIYKLDHWFEMMLPNATRMQTISPTFVIEYNQMREGAGEGADTNYDGALDGVGMVTFPLLPKPHECVQEEWVKKRWLGMVE